jgi:hypothetical protein
MNEKMSERWIEQVGSALDVRVEVDPEILIAGRNLRPWARVVDFGNAMGTLIFADPVEYLDCAEKLYDFGYAVSCFLEPKNMGDDASSAKDMLQDWGWSGPIELKPDWAA